MSPTPTKLKKGFHVIGNHDKMYKPCWMSLVKKNDDYKKLNACPRHDLHDKLKLKNSNPRSCIFFHMIEALSSTIRLTKQRSCHFILVIQQKIYRDIIQKSSYPSSYPT